MAGKLVTFCVSPLPHTLEILQTASVNFTIAMGIEVKLTRCFYYFKCKINQTHSEVAICSLHA